MDIRRLGLSKGILILVLAIYGILFVATWVVTARFETAARDDLAKSLSTVVGVTSHAVETWVKEQKSDARIWATGQNVQQLTNDLLQLTQHPQTLATSPVQAELRRWLLPVLTAKGYLGFFVIGRDNINLGSLRDSNLGVENLLVGQNGFLEKIWSGQAAMSLPLKSDVLLEDAAGNFSENIATMFVGAPIKNTSGDVIAALAFRIDPADDFSDIIRQGQIGQTGETYAFDINGRMFSESRYRHQIKDLGIIGTDLPLNLDIELRDPGVNLFEGEQPHGQRTKLPLTLMAENAVQGRSGLNVIGYRDYRGVQVIGAWIWEDDLKMGITTELDVREAYRNLNANKVVIYMAGILIAVLVTTLAAVFGFYRLQERTKQDLGNILQNMSQGVATFDANRRLSVWNNNYQNMFNFSPGLLKKGTPIEILISDALDRGFYGKDPVRKSIADRLETLWGEENTRTNLIVDTGRTYESMVQRMENGELVITYSDVTERERVQAEIIEQRDMLDDLNSQKNKFFSIIAHDLLGPFSVLLNYTEILKTSAQTVSREKIADISSSLNQATEQTLKLLENLLVWTRNEMNQIAFEPSACDLADITSGVIEELSFIAREKEIQLSNNISSQSVFADEQMAGTIIRNLVSNAIKFTPGGGEITLSAELKNELVEVEIADNGMGMKPERAASLFALGEVQSTVGTSGETGTGLGLMLCKEFVEKHGGAISVLSEPDLGSRFRFSLPVSAPRQAA
jgi:signal transduction histidine kinase